METFRFPIAQLQPSQLYISAIKLAHVQSLWQSPTLETLDPLPVKRLNGRIIYTDGHTRAFAAYRHGFTEVPVFWDEDELIGSPTKSASIGAWMRISTPSPIWRTE